MSFKTQLSEILYYLHIPLYVFCSTIFQFLFSYLPSHLSFSFFGLAPAYIHIKSYFLWIYPSHLVFSPWFSCLSHFLFPGGSLPTRQKTAFRGWCTYDSSSHAGRGWWQWTSERKGWGAWFVWRGKEDYTRNGGTNEGVLGGAVVVVVLIAVFVSFH